jgi:SAM-dependent methyltransferase
VPKAGGSWLAHPLTRGHDLDDPATTILRRRIIREKGFLQRVYREWYARIRAALPEGPGVVLELGSGGGFFREIVPDALTSDVLPLPGLGVVLAGERLPFRTGALKAIVMTNVFHHLPDARAFLREAERALRAGGRIVMIEPWNSPFGSLVYRILHHEPFEPGAVQWELPEGGPLSGANGALPWIVFERDKARFALEFPAWRAAAIAPLMPLAYLLSGGVSLRLGVPAAAYALVRGLESLLPQRACAMFAVIVLERLSHQPHAEVR